MEKKEADIDTPTGVESFAFVTIFYSHINFTGGLWVSSLYTEGHEAQWRADGGDTGGGPPIPPELLLLVPRAHLYPPVGFAHPCNS